MTAVTIPLLLIFGSLTAQMVPLTHTTGRKKYNTKKQQNLKENYHMETFAL